MLDKPSNRLQNPFYACTLACTHEYQTMLTISGSIHNRLLATSWSCTYITHSYTKQQDAYERINHAWFWSAFTSDRRVILEPRVYQPAEGGERACNSHILPHKCQNSNMAAFFSTVSNGYIWKRGLRSIMNMLYHLWIWFTTGCTCKLSMHKRCIYIAIKRRN